MKPALTFLDWSQTALDQAVALLLKEWQQGTVDLAGQLIVVPSSQAGRRLRERLAQEAAARGGCVLSPHVMTPSGLFLPPGNERPLAEAALALLAWHHVLGSADRGQIEPLLPGGTDSPEDAAALLAVAEQLIEIRELLCEEGHTITTFAQAYETNPEAERWMCLAALEQSYYATLDQNGLRDACQAKIETAHAGRPALDGVERIRVLFCPDLPRLAIHMLSACPEDTTLEIVVHAPEHMRDLFDEWGRPLSGPWANHRFSFPDEQIHRFPSTSEEAAFVANHLRDIGREAQSQLAIGVPDAESVPHLRNALAENSIPFYDPSGTPMRTTGLFCLLNSLSRFIERGDYDAFAALVRHPDMMDYLDRALPGFQVASLLEQLDRFQNKHLPPDYPAICGRLLSPAEQEEGAHPALANMLRVFDLWQAPMQTGNAETLLRQLAELFEGKYVSKKQAEAAAFMEVARETTQTVASIAGSKIGNKLETVKLLRLLMRLLARRKVPEERKGDALELLGWLELHWEDAPVLMLTGMTDQAVPECLVGHPFLPDGARAAMHMRDNAARYARDTYLLAAICASRPSEAVVFSFSKTNLDGEPRRPSRLLLSCHDDVLRQRAEYLFGEACPPALASHQVNRWQYHIPLPELPETMQKQLSVSDLLQFMACPFLFFLRRILRMIPQDDTKRELDAVDFGVICHAALERFAHSDLADSTHAASIAAFLEDAAMLLFTERYGRKLSAPLLIQRDAMVQRLRAAAAAQARERQKGWRIEAVEMSQSMTFGSVELVARIDRLDVHEKTGCRRIIDYKTTEKAHDLDRTVERLKKKSLKELCAVARNEWLLQLPLYAMIFAEHQPEQADQPGAAYFFLPRALSQTGVHPWPEMTPALLDEAKRETGTLISAIQARAFDEIRTKHWPPEFAAMFQNPVTSIQRTDNHLLVTL